MMSQEEYHEMNTLTPRGRRINEVMAIAHRKMEKLEAAGKPLLPLTDRQASEHMEVKSCCESCQGGMAELAENSKCFDCGKKLIICWFCIALGEHLQICHVCSSKRTNRWYESPRDADWLLKEIIHAGPSRNKTGQGSLPNGRKHKHTLYGIQEGKCAGCRYSFPFRNMTVDHIKPRSEGGEDHSDNLQLLCHACNSMKGTRSQKEFIARLRKERVIS